MPCTKLLLLLFLVFNEQLLAQVPVHDEPHHKPVLENEYVRLLDVHINLGDTTLYHTHNTASVIVFISHSQMGTQVMGKQPDRPNEVFPAQTAFAPFDKNPVTHRVFNSGNNVFHVMDIELVKQTASDSCAAVNQTGMQTTINEKLVRVYKFEVNNSSYSIDKNNCVHLLICVTGSVNAAGKNIPAGGYAFIHRAHPSA